MLRDRSLPLGKGGRISIYTLAGAHVLIDVAGWFTDATSAVATHGLFVPVLPTRVIDTRLGSGTLLAGDTRRLHIGGDLVVPPRTSSAIVANLTATRSRAEGYVTAFPTAGGRPDVSNLNLSHQGETIANLALVRLSDRSIDLFSQHTTDLIIDVSGWFTN